MWSGRPSATLVHVSSPGKRPRVARLFAALLSIAFVTATLLSGWTYSFCIRMQRPMATCCPKPNAQRSMASVEQPRVERQCCEKRSVAKQASASATQTEVSVQGAPVVGLATSDPIPRVDSPRRFVDRRRVDTTVRTDPPDRPAPLAAAPRFLVLCVQRC